MRYQDSSVEKKKTENDRQKDEIASLFLFLVIWRSQREINIFSHVQRSNQQ